ncbi:MAG TPA: hypothetical protein VJO34_13580, partial [Methylomirabilota bacterium]|nr:hypothetical protein [Methylomirabilota bacterium]
RAAIVGFFFSGGGALVYGPYGQVTRQELVRAAASQGPTLRVVTSQTQIPQIGLGLSVATGPNAQALAQNMQPGLTLYVAEIPVALLSLLIRIGLAIPKTTTGVDPTGVIGQEIRFLPAASQWIVGFFK